MSWFRFPSVQGDAQAQTVLGRIYRDGKTAPQNYAQAVEWYRKAADQGDTDAQYYLGQMYEEGHGAQQDYVHAHMWFNLAASGSAASTGVLGDFLLSGANVRAARMDSASIAPT